MFENTIHVQTRAGIHCRPSSMIISEAMKYPGNEFQLTSARGKSSLTSILDLLALGLQCGDSAVLRITGPQEQEAGPKIVELLEREFDFR